ncbi:unnamed protein product, partial [Mesorhabditis spiculigera]
MLSVLILIAQLANLAVATCPTSQVSTDCGFVSIFWGCIITGAPGDTFSLGVKTNVTLVKRCEENAENCVCGTDEVLYASTQQCRPKAQMTSDCMKQLQERLTGAVTISPKGADDLINSINEQTIHQSSPVCFCGYDDRGSYNGSCVQKSQATADCAIVISYQPASPIGYPPPNNASKSKRTGSAKTVNVCDAGDCYCPTGFVETADGDCVTSIEAMNRCTASFAAVNQACESNETLLPCADAVTVFMGCASSPPVANQFSALAQASYQPMKLVAAKAAAILVDIKRGDCKQANELRCSCISGYVKDSASQRCISRATAIATCP